MLLRRILFAAFVSLLLQACLAKAALDVAIAPVRIAGKAVDLATTSQSEADEKRGRALRKREEEFGRLERSYRKHQEQCKRGKEKACREAAAELAAMERLRATIPYEPRR